MLTTWQELLNHRIKMNGDMDEEGNYPVILKCTLDYHEMNKPFNCKSFWCDAKPFYAWTERYVYFCWDDDEEGWVGVTSVPRHPADIKANYI